MKTLSSRIRGFSLIELMVVMLIIGIIAAFVVPATSNILKGSQMTQGSQILYDQISLARQYALSKNHPVEVRLIRYVDPEVPNDAGPDGIPGAYRAVQIFETLDAIDTHTGDFVRVPLDKPALLPQAIVISPLSNFSTLISGLNQQVTSAGPRDPEMPRNVKRSYTYVSFRFMPDGSTNLPAYQQANDPNSPPMKWFVTIHNLTDYPNPSDTEVAVGGGANKRYINFYTIQIDPVSGAMKQFRPGI